MNRAVKQLQIIIGLAFLAILAASFYWSTVKSHSINQRQDNPRHVQQEQTLLHRPIHNRYTSLIIHAEANSALKCTLFKTTSIATIFENRDTYHPQQCWQDTYMFRLWQHILIAQRICYTLQNKLMHWASFP